MMVSLRRKKYKKSFVGEKRRSARLMALEVVGSSKSSSQIQWEGNTTGGNHEDAHHSQENGAISSNGICSSNDTTSKIIQHVLDILELKDTHELFTMPDNMQIDDYAERVSNPSDFATLRQKHIDGMYTTLEQFEVRNHFGELQDVLLTSDVYAVFKKAITINDHNTIPYKQAIFLQDQAKQSLQSLKNNNTNSQKEIPAWQLKHVRGRKKLRQNDKIANASSNRVLPNGKPNNNICSKRRLKNLEVIVTDNGNDACLQGTNRYLRNIQSRSNQNFQKSEESHLAEPRLTYLTDYNSNFGIMSPTLGSQNPYLVLSAHAPRYQESLCSFTKNAGMKAQKAAKEMCQAYTQNSKDPYFTGRPSLVPQISTISSGPSFDSTRPAQFFPQQMSLYNSSYCKLETDELLKWFQSIGTPEFIEMGNVARLAQKENIILENNGKKPTNQQHITDFHLARSKNLSQREISAPMKEATRLKDDVKDIENSRRSSSFNGIGSSQLGFSQYASWFKSFKPEV